MDEEHVDSFPINLKAIVPSSWGPPPGTHWTVYSPAGTYSGRDLGVWDEERQKTRLFRIILKPIFSSWNISR
jgi:hypothetical protein